MKKWKYDFILGAAVLLVSLGSILYAIMLSDPRATYFLARADSYLGLILGILSLLGVALMARAWKSRSCESEQQIVEPIWDKLTVVTVVALLVYMLIINHVGFILDSVVLMWLLSYLYAVKVARARKGAVDKKAQIKIAVGSLLFSVVSTLCTYWVFVELLGTKLPRFGLF